MSTSISMIVTDKSATFMLDGKSYNILDDHINYKKIINCLKTNDIEQLKTLVDITETVNKACRKHIKDGNVIEVSNGELLYNGNHIHSTMVGRILTMIEQGFDVNPMYYFLHNLMENPSFTAVDELYLFLESSNLPITPDGHFLAYKVVTSEFKDIYTRTIDNTIGTIVTVPRRSVDDKRDHLCSNGLHFAALSYIPHYGHSSRNDIVLIVKINPKNVVSIPSDYKNTKGRCCEYEVIGVYPYEWDDDRLSATSVAKTPTVDLFLPIEEISKVYGWLTSNAIIKRAKRGITFTRKEVDGNWLYRCIDNELHNMAISYALYDDTDKECFLDDYEYGGIKNIPDKEDCEYDCCYDDHYDMEVNEYDDPSIERYEEELTEACEEYKQIYDSYTDEEIEEMEKDNFKQVASILINKLLDLCGSDINKPFKLGISDRGMSKKDTKPSLTIQKDGKLQLMTGVVPTKGKWSAPRSLEDVAQILNITTNAVRKRAARGVSIKPVVDGRSVGYPTYSIKL